MLLVTHFTASRFFNTAGFDSFETETVL